jgi:hypothetical protein
MQDQFHDIALRLLKRGAPIHKLAFRLGIDVEELRNLEIWETLYQLARSGRHPPPPSSGSKPAPARRHLRNKKKKTHTPDPPIIRAIDKDGNLYG